MSEIEVIITGIGAGVTYALTAYGKKEGQAFDGSKFGATVIVGGVVGIAMAVLNLPVDVSYLYVMNLGIVPIAENLIKTMYRKLYLRFLKSD